MSFPEVIDSTILVSFRSCQKKAYYNYILGLQRPGLSVHLDFGGAFAKGIEAARRSFFIDARPAEEAIAAGLNAAWGAYSDREAPIFTDHAKNLGTLLLAIEGYFTQWPLGSDGVELLPSGVEFSFAVPIAGLTHPDTGGPIIYGGRFDAAGTYMGLETVIDEKTTSAFGDSWITQWALRNQFLGYCWGAQQYGFPASQALVRGVAIQKREIKYLQALVSYPAYMLERFAEQMWHDIASMIEAYRAGQWDYNFGDTCSSYGGCAMTELCKAKNPEEWYSMFVERKWEPLRARDDAA